VLLAASLAPLLVDLLAAPSTVVTPASGAHTDTTLHATGVPASVMQPVPGRLQWHRAPAGHGTTPVAAAEESLAYSVAVSGPDDGEQ
jgi:hypothetical protein